MKASSHILLIVLFSTAGVSKAQQPDFTFTVPISVENLHQHIDQVGVEILVCGVEPTFATSEAIDGGIAGCGMIGNNRVSANVQADGSYTGTFTITVDAGQNPAGHAFWNGISAENQDPATATHYAARIIVHNVPDNRWAVIQGEGSNRPLQEQADADASPPNVLKVKGAFPSN